MSRGSSSRFRSVPCPARYESLTASRRSSARSVWTTGVSSARRMRVPVILRGGIVYLGFPWVSVPGFRLFRGIHERVSILYARNTPVIRNCRTIGASPGSRAVRTASKAPSGRWTCGKPSPDSADEAGSSSGKRRRHLAVAPVQAYRKAVMRSNQNLGPGPFRSASGTCVGCARKAISGESGSNVRIRRFMRRRSGRGDSPRSR